MYELALIYHITHRAFPEGGKGLLDRVGAFEINLVTYFEPVVATVIGWAVRSERLEPLSIVDLVVIAVGFVLVQRERIRDYATTRSLLG